MLCHTSNIYTVVLYKYIYIDFLDSHTISCTYACFCMLCHIIQNTTYTLFASTIQNIDCHHHHHRVCNIISSFFIVRVRQQQCIYYIATGLAVALQTYYMHDVVRIVIILIQDIINSIHSTHTQRLARIKGNCKISRCVVRVRM